ncbi:helix-turn-helix domain-containing protein [Paramicrobacterium sp. CJ85]|uniref:helix-turn-helix domain-containing protein n=1 Tax=Paramicrobacterium sp. CJ85 TaxID=3445355 RepID=UPI003F5F2395
MAPREPEGEPTGIHCRLDELLAERGMTLTQLSETVGVSIVNLSVLKNDRAKAIRFSTLVAICDALRCTPGDLLERSGQEPPQ